MISTAIRTLAAASLALVAAVGLSACTANSSGGDQKPAATASASTKIAETQYNDCIDGSLQVFDDSKDTKPATFGDCAGASIISSGRTITLGTVPTLTVEGQKNTVDVTGVKSLTVLGNENTITYHGTAPKVDDQGKGNAIKPAG